MLIDLVTPPFAGHLFPILQLAAGLRDRGFANLRLLSSGAARNAVRSLGLEHVDILPGCDERIRSVSDTTTQVGSSPIRLHHQFKHAMALLLEAHHNLQSLWARQRPGVVIADFTIPVVGPLAQRLDIAWWTSMPSPCVIETRRGIPAYLGGWLPRDDWLGRLRDHAGRGFVRAFKHIMFAVASRQLRAIGINRLYRPDGSETAYSPQSILGLGLEDFEFPRNWPRCFRFIGPLTASPPLPHSPPVFVNDRPHILVTLGTHLPWARPRAVEIFQRVATAMPDCVVHFALGKSGEISAGARDNFHEYAFIPYDHYMECYQAVVHHGGTGVMYASMRAGLPALVWPHDYDQKDHAARLTHHNLARRLRPSVQEIVNDLRAMLNSTRERSPLKKFQKLVREADPVGFVARALYDLARARRGADRAP